MYLKEKKTILVTGGGSGGHTISAMTVINVVRQKNPEIEIVYIGGHDGLEKKIAESEGIKYFGISTGKLRRYFSWENFRDIFRIIKGFFDSLKIVSQFDSKQTLLFSTGGFVSVPPVVAAWILRIPIMIHEQTSRVGLANRIASKFSKKVLTSFAASNCFFDKSKVITTGYPLRPELFQPLKTCVIDSVDLGKIQKKILFITGGGNGAKLLNDLVLRIKKELENDYYILHQVGDKFAAQFGSLKSENYLPVSFINCMPEVLKIADVVVSRAGAGTVYELLVLGKKSIFVPLKIAQKNEQFHNAMEAKTLLGSIIVTEDEVSSVNWVNLINGIQDQKRVQGASQENPAYLIHRLILEEFGL
jgi:UDP-N-acetylglucosamine--N-acetylmuramyl-(pentapeptide) pyrophosphoryl-undecaprenol N-acetylglucosamine transferase